MLNWTNRFSIFCFLDNHRYQTNYHSLDCLLAVGSKSSFTANAGHALNDFQDFLNERPQKLFGHLCYELKNEIESLTSSHNDRIGFPDIFFFEPEIIIKLSEKEMEIESEEDTQKIFESIMHNDHERSVQDRSINIQQRVSKKEYIDTIEQLKK